MKSTVHCMKQTCKPSEVQEVVGGLQKLGILPTALKKLYDELEEQYKHVLERFENQ